jgi:hypothetical protein
MNVSSVRFVQLCSISFQSLNDLDDIDDIDDDLSDDEISRLVAKDEAGKFADSMIATILSNKQDELKEQTQPESGENADLPEIVFAESESSPELHEAPPAEISKKILAIPVEPKIQPAPELQEAPPAEISSKILAIPVEPKIVVAVEPKDVSEGVETPSKVVESSADSGSSSKRTDEISEESSTPSKNEEVQEPLMKLDAVTKPLVISKLVVVSEPTKSQVTAVLAPDKYEEMVSSSFAVLLHGVEIFHGHSLIRCQGSSLTSLRRHLFAVNDRRRRHHCADTYSLSVTSSPRHLFVVNDRRRHRWADTCSLSMIVVDTVAQTCSLSMSVIDIVPQTLVRCQ